MNGSAGVAVLLFLLGAALIVMAARGTYYDVWHAVGGALTPQAAAAPNATQATSQTAERGGQQDGGTSGGSTWLADLRAWL